MKEDIGVKIILKYNGKNYICEGIGWREGCGYCTPYDPDCGVRSCEHDYASLLPSCVTLNKEFGCEQKEIELVDYYFYDKETNKKI